MLSKVFNIFRFVVGLALGYGLIHITLKYTGANFWGELIHASKLLLLLALLVHGVILCIASYRWKLLLGFLGMHFGLLEVLRLVLIGVSFNFVVPGAVGGDLVKMALVAQVAEKKRPEAILTIFLDRALGLLGLFIVASIMVLFYISFLLDLEGKYRPIQIAAFTVGLGTVGAVCTVTIIGLWHKVMQYGWIARLANFITQKLPASFLTVLNRLVNALDLYRRKPGILLSGLGLSILVHSFLAINLFLVGVSVAGNALNLSDFFLVTPVANAVAAIPITPGGIGTRDATIALFLNAMNAPAKTVAIVPILMTIIFLFWGIVGGVLFIFYKGFPANFQSHSVFPNEEFKYVPGKN